MIEEIMKWAVPFICGGIATWCITLLKSRRKYESAFADGMQCLLRDEIIHKHEKYMERGICPIYAKESLRREYEAYHALGGNDVATRLYEEVMELPTE